MGARIAIVAEWYPPATGGLEEAARRLARLSVALGLAVEVVTPDPLPHPPGWRTVTEADGVTVTRATPTADEPLRAALAAALAARGPVDGVVVFGLRHYGGLAVRQAAAWGVPSLICARGSDVLLLAQHFVEQAVAFLGQEQHAHVRATRVNTAEGCRIEPIEQLLVQQQHVRQMAFDSCSQARRIQERAAMQQDPRRARKGVQT